MTAPPPPPYPDPPPPYTPGDHPHQPAQYMSYPASHPHGSYQSQPIYTHAGVNPYACSQPVAHQGYQGPGTVYMVREEDDRTTRPEDVLCWTCCLATLCFCCMDYMD